MSDRVSVHEELQSVFETRIRPVVFPHAPADGEPRLLFTLGQPGASVGRATGSLVANHRIAVLSASDLQAFHPRYLELSRSPSPEAYRTLTESASGWMRSALQHARTTGRSLVLDGTLSSPDIALAITGLFGGSGFDTTVVVVAIPRAESLLATASGFLLDVRAGRASRLTTVGEHDTGYENTRNLVQTLEATPSVDRLTIVGSDGTVRFDAYRKEAAGFSGARSALERAHATALSPSRAMRWLSELRAATDYALSAPQLGRPLAELLVELHEVGLGEVPQPAAAEGLSSPTDR